MLQTGLVWHELYMWHDTGRYAGILQPNPSAWLEPHIHFENADTKRRIKNLLDATGFINHFDLIQPREVTRGELLRVHTPAHLTTLDELNKTGGEASLATPINVGGFDIAKLSAGGCLALLDAICEGRVRNGYALCRPPGHHALADMSMGFCFLANGPIVARAAQQKGLKKVAIVDWDVHHGNGPEAIFYNDPSVLTISLHQDNCFPPESGAVESDGSGKGKGYNINCPLPPGSGRGAYIYAFDEVVVPALDRFAPDIILVASGFDSMGQDPLGRNMLYSSVYAEMTDKLMAIADQYCDGRILMTHEGGYNPNAVPFSALKVLERLSGQSSGVEDPFEPFIAGMGGQELMAHQRDLIDKIAVAFGLRETDEPSSTSKSHGLKKFFGRQ